MAFSFDLAVIFQQDRRIKRRSTVRRKRRKTRRDMCKSDDEPMPEIPFDLVIEILTKLPSKSLMRFKSVSKLWSSLICSRTFTNRWLRVSSSAPRLYVSLSFSENNHPKTILLSSSSLPSSDIVSSFVIDQDLTISAMNGFYLSHVFRGLMCFVKESSAQIYNVTTRQLVVLPDIEESDMIADNDQKTKIMYHMGHDPVYDQYKVFCIVAKPSYEDRKLRTFLSEHWVFLLGGDESSRWRKVPCRSPHLPITEILNINGCLHYLAWVGQFSPMLVSFDYCSEEISMHQASEDNYFVTIAPIEYCGKVALLDYFDLRREGKMKLWFIEDAEKNMWSNKTLVVHPSQIHLVVSDTGLRVQGTTRNGELVLVPKNITYSRNGEGIRQPGIKQPQNTNLVHIFLYDLQKNLIRKVEIKETPCHTKIWDVVGFDYVENLVCL